ncbi:hypothetical protein ACH4F6_30120 [Streptomyces sp. NPDC017936]|uniref:hypothetical protein n=1 Tax=Streptomyces sp. NPDC017936 TaxID=3365016 RepID=UPI003789E2D6
MSTVPPALIAVPIEGREPFCRRLALDDGAGRLVRSPDPCAAGPFHRAGPGRLIAPAADTQKRWGHLDHLGQ